MKLTIRAFGRELFAVDLDHDTTQPCDRPHRDPVGFGPGSTLRLDNPPQRAGRRPATRPARADHQEDHR